MSQPLSEGQIQRLMGLSAKDGNSALWQGLETLLPHLDHQAVATLQISCDASLGLFCFRADDCDLFLLVDGRGQVHFGQVRPLILHQSIPMAAFVPSRDTLGSVVITRRLRIAGSTLDAMIMFRSGEKGETSVYHAEIVLERHWLLRPVHYQSRAADGWLPVAATEIPQWLVQWTIHRDEDPPFHEPPQGLRKLNPAKSARVLCSASHVCFTQSNKVYVQGPHGRSWVFPLSPGSRIVALRSTQEEPRVISLRNHSAFLYDPVDKGDPRVSLLVQGPVAQIAFTGKAEEVPQYLVLFADGRLVHLCQVEDQRILRLWQRIWQQIALSKGELEGILRQADFQSHDPRSLIVRRRALEHNALAVGSSNAPSCAPDPMLDLVVWLNQERRPSWRSLLYARSHLFAPQIWSVGSYNCVYLEANAVFEQMQEFNYPQEAPLLPHLINDGPVEPPANLKGIAVRRVYRRNRIREYSWRPMHRYDLLLPEVLERPDVRSMIIATIIAGRSHLTDAKTLREEIPQELAERIDETLARFQKVIQAAMELEEKVVETRDQVASVPVGTVNLKLGDRYGQFLCTVSERFGLRSKLSFGRVAFASFACGIMGTLLASGQPVGFGFAALVSMALGLRAILAEKSSAPPLLLVIASDDVLGWSFCSYWIRSLTEHNIAHLEDPYTTELLASQAPPPAGSCLFNLTDMVTGKRSEVLLVHGDAWSQRSDELAYLLGESRRILSVLPPGDSDWEAPWGSRLAPYQAKLEEIAWDLTSPHEIESERLSQLLTIMLRPSS